MFSPSLGEAGMNLRADYFLALTQPSIRLFFQKWEMFPKTGKMA